MNPQTTCIYKCSMIINVCEYTRIRTKLQVCMHQYVNRTNVFFIMQICMRTHKCVHANIHPNMTELYHNSWK